MKNIQSLQVVCELFDQQAEHLRQVVYAHLQKYTSSIEFLMCTEPYPPVIGLSTRFKNEEKQTLSFIDIILSMPINGMKIF